MSKYYRPDLNEFYTGFEYEEIVNVVDNKLILEHRVFNEDIDLKTIKNNLDAQKSTIRYSYLIKYLDSEDIKNLGFTLYDRFVDNYCGDFFEYYTHEDNKVILEFQSCTPYITIRAKETREFPSKSYYWFQGNIKNKSELKKLLKQLCITK